MIVRVHSSWSRPQIEHRPARDGAPVRPSRHGLRAPPGHRAPGGVSTTVQARDRYSDWEIRRLVQSGRWCRTRWRGVLADAELPDSPVVQVRAAALAAGPDLVACHSTAALLWGFDVLGSDVLHFLGPPQLVNHRLPGVQVHPSSLGTDDAVLVDGLWCTSAARTACDVVRLTGTHRRSGHPGRGVAFRLVHTGTTGCRGSGTGRTAWGRAPEGAGAARVG